MTVKEYAEYLLANFDPNMRVVRNAQNIGYYDTVPPVKRSIVINGNFEEAKGRHWVGPHCDAREDDKDNENFEEVVLI